MFTVSVFVVTAWMTAHPSCFIIDLWSSWLMGYLVSLGNRAVGPNQRTRMKLFCEGLVPGWSFSSLAARNLFYEVENLLTFFSDELCCHSELRLPVSNFPFSSEASSLYMWGHVGHPVLLIRPVSPASSHTTVWLHKWCLKPFGGQWTPQRLACHLRNGFTLQCNKKTGSHRTTKTVMTRSTVHTMLHNVLHIMMMLLIISTFNEMWTCFSN